VWSGEIKGNQGHRSDLDRIEEMLDDGKKPDEIFAESFGYTRYSKQIRDEYFRRRKSSTPTSREMECHLIIGDSGSGKTHTYIDLCNQYGDQEVCIISDYENGGFDHYAGEKILFMDEYKGQLSYSAFLSITDHYKVQVHARYSNIWALWQQVYITSIYPPEELYNIMVPENRRTTDSIEQLYRRLTDITYCYKKGKEYKQVTIPATQYKDYKSLKRFALYGKK
jgi:hypothetical protein